MAHGNKIFHRFGRLLVALSVLAWTLNATGTLCASTMTCCMKEEVADNGHSDHQSHDKSCNETSMPLGAAMKNDDACCCSSGNMVKQEMQAEQTFNLRVEKVDLSKIYGLNLGLIHTATDDGMPTQFGFALRDFKIPQFYSHDRIIYLQTFLI